MLDSYNPIMVNCLHGHGMIQSVNFFLWLTGPLLHLWRLMMGIRRASSSYFMQEDHLRFAFVWLYKAGHVLGAAMLILLLSKRFTLEAIPMKKIIIFVLLKSLHNSLKPSKSQLLITSLALNKPRVDVLLEKTHDESYHFLVSVYITGKVENNNLCAWNCHKGFEKQECLERSRFRVYFWQGS